MGIYEGTAYVYRFMVFIQFRAGAVNDPVRSTPRMKLNWDGTQCDVDQDQVGIFSSELLWMSRKGFREESNDLPPPHSSKFAIVLDYRTNRQQ
jgi:hypothetical protein